MAKQYRDLAYQSYLGRIKTTPPESPGTVRLNSNAALD